MAVLQSHYWQPNLMLEDDELLPRAPMAPLPPPAPEVVTPSPDEDAEQERDAREPVEPVAAAEPTPQAPVRPLATGQADVFSDEAVRQAQAEADKRRRRAGIFETIAGLGSAITRTTPDRDFWARQREQSGQPLRDLAQRRQATTVREQRARQQAEQEREGAKRDPNSEVNRRFRAALPAWIPQDTRNSFTLADYEGAGGSLVRMLQQSHEREQRQAFARQQTRDQRAYQDRVRQQDLTARERRARIMAGHRVTRTARAAQEQDRLRGLAERLAQHRYPDDPARRQAFVEQYVTDNTFRRREAGREEPGTQQGGILSTPAGRAAARYTKDYQKSRARRAQFMQRIDQLEALIGESGDIPGVGAGGMVPSAAYQVQRALGINARDADRALQIRNARDMLVEDALRRATGAAAPESEKRQYRELAQAIAGASDEDLRRALHRFRAGALAVDREEYVALPQEARDYLERNRSAIGGSRSEQPSRPASSLASRRSEPSSERQAPTGNERVTVHNPQTGETLEIPRRRLEEARADGFELVI